MIVHLVLQALLTDLVEPVKLIEIDRVAVRHDHAMEYNRHPPLLPKAIRTNLASFPEHDGSVGDQNVLMFV